MTSKIFQQECYVYIMLPGSLEPVTAGRFVLTMDQHNLPIGRFVYGKSYLARPDAVSIDPIELKLSSNVYETVSLNGVFGALRDSGPDYWGRCIIEKYAQKPVLSELDYLLYSSDDRAGALGFGVDKIPPPPKHLFNQSVDLLRLQEIADSIVAGKDLPFDVINEQIHNLITMGTSIGGARPKVVVEDSEGLWIAKFNRSDDGWNYARVEHAMLVLGKNCGLDVAQSKVETVGGKDVLLVKRFDREKTGKGYLRSRMISALTMLRSDEQTRNQWSYVLLSEELRRVSADPKKDARELFLRMCFNALISNADDHPRNHALIAKDLHWRLSPAYDLTPSTPISMGHRDLAMICGDHGRFATQSNLLSQHARFLIDEEEALFLMNQMKDYIQNNWHIIARAEGVNEKDCTRIASAFVYPGFTQGFLNN